MRVPTGDEVPLNLNFRTDQPADGCDESEGPGAAYPAFDRVRSEVQPLGQLRDSFIVATDSSGLIVIDQHVAHERVLFEAYLRQKLAGKLDIQRLLMPIITQLPPRQLVILDSIVPELARNGFEVEPFGPKTIAIKTAPAILKAAAVEKGSGTPNKDKVGKVTRAQVEEIARTKMPDLNADSLDAAVRIIEGSARSMGIEVDG